MIGYLCYVFILAFWTASGIQTSRVIRTQQHVATAYASFLEVFEDTHMFYREAGTDHLETVLFIHGFLGSSYDFIDVFEALADRYHVLAVDMIGFGLSDKPETYHYGKRNQARTIAHFLQLKSVSNVTIIAHSMGGEVSLHLAYEFPQLVKNMILVGSAGYVPEQTQAGPPSLPLFAYQELVLNYYVQRFAFFTAYSAYEIENGLITNADFDPMFFVNRTIPPRILRKFGEDNDTVPIPERLAALTQDILLIWGEYDNFIAFERGQRLQEAIGDNAQLVKIDQAGHLPFDTFFDVFMQHVEAFL
jgi:pimeloyl-ACP methyl ester carboxylesterase